MLICFFYSRAKSRKNILEKSVRRLILCVTGTVVMNATAVLMPTHTSTLVFQ
ncbi:MAG: hypothetical protein HDT23_01480 [Ruminococcus sp.]|nr:hypothetical protein [Ruminococcus sp.]